MAHVNAFCFECGKHLTAYDVHDCCRALLDAFRAQAEVEPKYNALVLENIDCALICYNCAAIEIKLFEHFEEGVHTCQ